MYHAISFILIKKAFSLLLFAFPSVPLPWSPVLDPSRLSPRELAVVLGPSAFFRLPV